MYLGETLSTVIVAINAQFPRWIALSMRSLSSVSAPQDVQSAD